MKTAKLQKNSYAWAPGAGVVYLTSAPQQITKNGEEINAIVAKIFHPGARAEGKKEDGVTYDHLTPLPSKDEFKAMLAHAGTAQDPILQSDLKEKFFDCAVNGSPKDFATVIAYTNGRKGEIEGYHSHILLSLIHLQMALTFQERGVEPPAFDSDKWNSMFERAANRVQDLLPNSEQVITPFIHEIEEKRLEEDSREWVEAYHAQIIAAFAHHAEAYAAVKAQRDLGGKKGKKLERERKAAGKSARPSLKDVKLNESQTDLIGSALIGTDEFLWNKKTRQKPVPANDKRWQSDRLHEFAKIKTGGGTPAQKTEIVTLFEDDKLTVQEAALIMAGAYERLIKDELIPVMDHFCLQAYAYEFYNDLTVENVRDKIRAAAQKAVQALPDNGSQPQTQAKRHLQHYLR